MRTNSLKNNTELFKKLYITFRDFSIVEQVGKQKMIVSKTEEKSFLNEQGNLETKICKVYNMLLSDGTFASEKWFDIYEFDGDDCIIGFERSQDDCERLRNIPDYTCSGYLREKFMYVYGLINEWGNLTIKPFYDWLVYGGEDTYIGYHNAKMGYISSVDGKHITPIIFSTQAFPFSEGLACVCYNGGYGYVDRNKILEDPTWHWQYAIPPIYEWGDGFENGVAEVRFHGETIKIDRNNQRVENKVKNIKVNKKHK